MSEVLFYLFISRTLYVCLIFIRLLQSALCAGYIECNFNS